MDASGAGVLVTAPAPDLESRIAAARARVDEWRRFRAAVDRDLLDARMVLAGLQEQAWAGAR